MQKRLFFSITGGFRSNHNGDALQTPHNNNNNNNLQAQPDEMKMNTNATTGSENNDGTTHEEQHIPLDQIFQNEDREPVLDTTPIPSLPDWLNELRQQEPQFMNKKYELLWYSENQLRTESFQFDPDTWQHLALDDVTKLKLT